MLGFSGSALACRTERRHGLATAAEDMARFVQASELPDLCECQGRPARAFETLGMVGLDASPSQPNPETFDLSQISSAKAHKEQGDEPMPELTCPDASAQNSSLDMP